MEAKEEMASQATGIEAQASSEILREHGWVQLVDEHGATYFLHEKSGHAQSHPPVLTPLVRHPSIIKSQSSRTFSSRTTTKLGKICFDDRGKAFQVEALRNESKSMASDYMSEVDKYNQAKPYARLPDNTYQDTPCILCHGNSCRMVFFPCQHKCACDPCIRSIQSVPSNVKPRICPVCQSDIKVMFEHTGNEANEYWKWVYEVKPQLSWTFEHKFKQAGTKLGRKKTLNGITHPMSSPARRVSQLFRIPVFNHADTLTHHLPQGSTTERTDISKSAARHSCLLM